MPEIKAEDIINLTTDDQLFGAMIGTVASASAPAQTVVNPVFIILKRNGSNVIRLVTDDDEKVWVSDEFGNAQVSETLASGGFVTTMASKLDQLLQGVTVIAEQQVSFWHDEEVEPTVIARIS